MLLSNFLFCENLDEMRKILLFEKKKKRNREK